MKSQIFLQEFKGNKNSDRQHNSRTKSSKNNEESSCSDSDEEPMRKKKAVKRGMPRKRCRRIFVGLGVTILVMSPLVTAIIFGTLLDDTIRYVFHKVDCQGRKNELRVIQVIL